MRTPLRSLAILAAAALPLAAQGIADGTVIAGPQFVSYTFGTGASAKSVNQVSIPFAIIIPFGERFTFDVSSSYANSQVRAGGATTSSISGLTDTQLRGNLMVGDNAAIFTVGVNIPTGKYTIATDQQEAAGQIGNDFLVYPVSGMGNGLGATGGVAIAKSLGTWNLGLGGSFRHSTQFDAYQQTTGALRFTPGDEYRVRAGLDRPVGDGRFSVGLTYSKFGKDAADTKTFSTGDRALGQLNYSTAMGTGDFQVSAWNLYRAAGEQFGGVAAPWENVANVNVAVGFNAGSLYVQPSAEARAWNVDGNKAGQLGTVGLRLRFNMGALSVNPSGQYTIGKLYTGGTTDVKGFRAGVLIRIQ